MRLPGLPKATAGGSAEPRACLAIPCCLVWLWGGSRGRVPVSISHACDFSGPDLLMSLRCLQPCLPWGGIRDLWGLPCPLCVLSAAQPSECPILTARVLALQDLHSPPAASVSCGCLSVLDQLCCPVAPAPGAATPGAVAVSLPWLSLGSSSLCGRDLRPAGCCF